MHKDGRATYGAAGACEVDAPGVDVDACVSAVLESHTGMMVGSASNLLRLCTNSSSRRDDASYKVPIRSCIHRASMKSGVTCIQNWVLVKSQVEVVKNDSQSASDPSC